MSQLRLSREGINASAACAVDIDLPVVLGRADRAQQEAEWQCHARSGSPDKFAIVHNGVNGIPREFLKIVQTGPDSVQFQNISRGACWIGDRELAIGEQADFSLPVRWRAAEYWFELTPIPVDSQLESLSAPSIPPGLSFSSESVQTLLRPLSKGEITTDWLQRILGVMQSILASNDFLSRAEEALIKMVGLDVGKVLIRHNGEWVHLTQDRVQTSHASQRLLSRLLAEKRTVWETPSSRNEFESMKGMELLIAAPILNKEGEVHGALYGSRSSRGAVPPRLIDQREALLVEVLAGGVAAGLSRQQHQLQIQHFASTLQQFFGDRLSEMIVKDKGLLAPRDAKVTVMFADIQGFSRISERISTQLGHEWISNTMDVLSRHVLEQQGVIVRYMGDEIYAMWGAPHAQEDQCARAVEAALGMLESLTDLNIKWEQDLGEPIRLGIGLNFGPAQVGNVGSQGRFQYDALGNSVNIASRVQGMTKHFKCSLLVTQAVIDEIRDREQFISRRVCKVRAVNIQEPIDLFEIHRAGDAARRELFKETDEALAHLESKNFGRAASSASQSLLKYHGDGPLLLILSRAAEMLRDADRPFSKAWDPGSK